MSGDVAAGASSATKTPYRVLARRWRPTKLVDLVGQEVLAQTLANALTTGQLAHAFLFSGIRGVGKTTTARTLARALNCTGIDGQGGPTADPCGQCASCLAMDDGKAIDVIEMDAATRTGINDIREIVDSVRYAPSASRFKIFIIDEVHMLSLQAFNGLLKTLEEPPSYVKFIFATTEVRKLPVTILSRCQRFDLKRIPLGRLTEHYAMIAKDEAIDIDDDAVRLIARAAQGSVRDGLSLLDQARALNTGTIHAEAVRQMLGLADQGVDLAILSLIADGQITDLLHRYRELSSRGADPTVFVQDLMDLSHALSCHLADPNAVPEEFAWLAQDDAAQALTAKLTPGHLSRLWQMLLHGLEELRLASNLDQAVEMLLIRIAFAIDLPPPDALLAMIKGGNTQPSSPSRPAESNVRPVSPQARAQTHQRSQAQSPQSWRGLVDLLYERGDKMLAAMVEQHCRIAKFEPGRIEFAQTGGPSDLTGRLAGALHEATAMRWLVATSSEKGEASLMEQAKVHQSKRLSELSQRPEIQSLMEEFPGTRLVEVRQPQAGPVQTHDDQSHSANTPTPDSTRRNMQ